MSIFLCCYFNNNNDDDDFNYDYEDVVAVNDYDADDAKNDVNVSPIPTLCCSANFFSFRLHFIFYYIVKLIQKNH